MTEPPVPPDQRDRQDAYRAKHPDCPPHPHPPRSVFAGRGLFTVEHYEDAAGLRLDWIAAAVNAWTWRIAGGIIYQDESPEQHREAMDAPVIIGEERALVTSLDPAIYDYEMWPAGWTCMPECYWNADGGKPDEGRSVERMIYQAKSVIGPAWGRVPVVPVIGCYDASGENPGVGIRLTVPDYLPHIQAVMKAEPCVVGWAVWRVETLDAADRKALA